MSSGGARNRSGPSPQAGSARSDARGLRLRALPSEGYQGVVPEFLLPEMRRYVFVMDEDGKRTRQFDEESTQEFRSRELEVWVESWRTPQASAWARESWRWPIIAEYARLKTVVEREPDANAALVGQMHRFRDQIGLTPAGLKENGWMIAADEVAEQRESRAEPAERPAPTRRLRVVSGGDA